MNPDKDLPRKNAIRAMVSWKKLNAALKSLGKKKALPSFLLSLYMYSSGKYL
jgi:hypothetical protein